MDARVRDRVEANRARRRGIGGGGGGGFEKARVVVLGLRSREGVDEAEVA